MKNKNLLLIWKRATEVKTDDGRKGLAKWVNVKIRCNNREVFGRTKNGHFKWRLQKKKTGEIGDGKIIWGRKYKRSQRDVGEQQMNGTPYFMEF